MTARSGCWRAALVFALAAACHRDPAPISPASGPAIDRLPVLRLQHVSTTVDNSPRSRFAIGPQGTILNADDQGDGLLYSLIDSTGAVLRRVGRRGEGPGEIRGGWSDIFDSSFVVYDESQGRAVRFALDGKPLATVQGSEGAIPRISISDHEALAVHARSSGWSPVIVSTVSGKMRDLFSAPDSFITASFPAEGVFANGDVLSSTMAVLGLWPGGFVAADGWRYRLAFYSWDGRLQRVLRRDLPPPHRSDAHIDEELSQDVNFRASRRGRPSPPVIARMRAAIASRREPYFTHLKPLGLDGQGRVWVIGEDADSGFADLFNEHRFLGRIALPCHGFRSYDWSLKGDWLALACAPEDPAFEGDAVFKVFRIEDP